MKTLIVNLFGGPGAGKSAFAHGLMYELKVLGIDCELASEYAKDIYYEESPKKLDNQVYVFGKQLHRLRRINGKVNVIVTDAPLLHSIHYDANKSEAFKNLILEEHFKFTNLNIFLTRRHDYNQNGRFQDEAGATQISNSIEKILTDNAFDLHYFDATRENLKVIADVIVQKMSNDERSL